VAIGLIASAATAQTRNTSSSRVRLIRAYCTTGPCDPFFTFQGGAALIKLVKQPKLVSNRKLGNIRVSSLQRLQSLALPTYLEAQIIGTTFYGPDLNAACPLANTIVTGPIATSTMSCVVGAAGDASCFGNLFFIDLTDPACSDVQQTIRDLDIQVYEGGYSGVPERQIASFGMNILGRSPDCASGGAGCP
jgi:hypothetical protein